MVTILNQIYEEDFLGFSHGFRPGRSQHDALDALSYALLKKKVNYILDADQRGHTDTMVPVDSIQVRPAHLSDLDQLALLWEALWPKSSAEEHAQELRLILGGNAALVLTMPLIIFVAEANDGTLVGFLEVDLRSHADGCNPSRPVGYIEGWYVNEDWRQCGVGRKLLAEAEDWARSHRCVEMASDALIDNELSQRAHKALGYEVVDRCVHYRKRL